ncbi:protein SODIUM POTASSIUM ROOT DEFECTIVE 2-like [Neltuma alba]|uniref:protein SODIUM POTASSIUM ROOT DEFECTIVE 2-like n=1 Tax=Neltuma alba TaxID=207710 RepID=UPI0010A53145|nr:protein SODIUM POTASSIUM ROOT DEFECTIVE 2-like [Prosopis alba]
MKGIDILCSSQASTATCVGMDQALSSSYCSSSNSIQLGGRAIDRHNPIIKNPSRFPSKALATPSSSSHSRPDPYHHHKAKKSSCSKPKDMHNKSSAKSHDQKNQSSGGKPSENMKVNYSSNPINSILRRNWVRVRPPADSMSPAGSSRYLLSDADDYEPVLALPSSDDHKSQVVLRDEASIASKPSASSDQVVVLRVSLHCKGCVGKVRKHLSRMDGVSSFSIDLAAKKVTIAGDVNPLDVLTSVSKVKNAQFWPASAETKTASLI